MQTLSQNRFNHLGSGVHYFRGFSQKQKRLLCDSQIDPKQQLGNDLKSCFAHRILHGIYESYEQKTESTLDVREKYHFSKAFPMAHPRRSGLHTTYLLPLKVDFFRD